MDFSAVFLSTGVVLLAEMGDKTQLLSLMLAARYPRQALAIIAGIFLATLANHACAAYFGHAIAAFLSPDVLRWILGVGFLASGFWLLIPDRLDEVGFGDVVVLVERVVSVLRDVLDLAHDAGDDAALSVASTVDQF
jgi:putative Ca2+/H+ antiporter (TMEM165/GDT1 family)